MDYAGGQFSPAPAGTLCVVEKAVVDGEWASCYTTLESLDRFMDSVGEDE